jgi:hypothetical protein
MAGNDDGEEGVPGAGQKIRGAERWLGVLTFANAETK